jgi:hypothetical protein
MPQDVPPLEPRQQALLAETLGAWAEVHPRRHLPLIQLADDSELTPIDLAHAAAEPDSSHGQLIQRVFSNGLRGDTSEPQRPLEQILGAYRRDTERWRGQRFEQ